MAAITTIRATSLTDQRLRIAREADAKAEEANGIVLASGFEIDWPALMDRVAESTGPAMDLTGLLAKAVLGRQSGAPETKEIDVAAGLTEHEIRREFATDEFRDTITALAINGAGLAAWTQRQNEILAGFKDARKVQVFSFKEPAIHVPTKAIEYWRKLLGLTEEQAGQLAIDAFRRRGEGAKIADRIATALIERLQKIHDETISKGTNLSEFIAKVREIAPDASRALLETEYRTHMATVYGAQLHEQIVARASAFPFTQFFAIIDNRTTDLICRPMGTAGPGGKGYIAASNDPVWIRWRTPCHWKCRSMHSPISYREAQRMGILGKDGRTKIAIIGNNPERPYGDPPRFATDEKGELREVKPQEGFGG